MNARERIEEAHGLWEIAVTRLAALEEVAAMLYEEAVPIIRAARAQERRAFACWQDVSRDAVCAPMVVDPPAAPAWPEVEPKPTAPERTPEKKTWVPPGLKSEAYVRRQLAPTVSPDVTEAGLKELEEIMDGGDNVDHCDIRELIEQVRGLRARVQAEESLRASFEGAQGDVRRLQSTLADRENEITRLKRLVGGEPEVATQDARGGIISEVLAERLRQDEKWGGPDHDDEHEQADWNHFIALRVDGSPSGAPPMRKESFRERLIQVAALAIAALESNDRKAPPVEPRSSPVHRGTVF